MTPDLLSQLAQEVLDCVYIALGDTRCGAPCRNFIGVGQIAWDSCCDDGQLWVAIERIYPINNFPAVNTGAVQCGAQLAADLVIGIVRCAPTQDDNGNPPTPEQLNISSDQVYQDMYAIMTSLICCLSEAKRNRLFVIHPQRPVGPQGGCVGSETRFTVQLIDPPLGVTS